MIVEPIWQSSYVDLQAAFLNWTTEKSDKTEKKKIFISIGGAVLRAIANRDAETP